MSNVSKSIFNQNIIGMSFEQLHIVEEIIKFSDVQKWNLMENLYVTMRQYL